ncbi:MAG: bifunctional oligoribonuclease/PAP phosphatase NrnA [Candidatus Moraniibacteriota bacterium]
MPNFTFSFLEEQVRKATNILILTHIDPDGDALGAVLAMKNVLTEWGRNPDISFSGKIGAGIKITDKTIPPNIVDTARYDLILILDTSNPQRTGIIFPEDLSTLNKVLIIDHHLKKDDRMYPQSFNLLINPEAAATCEIIFDLLKEGGKEISNVTASYLLLGIYTDTGGFFHSNTTPGLLLKIKELLKRGVLFKNIIQSSFRGRSVRVLNFWGEKISHAVFHPKLKFIFSWLNQKELDEKKISTEEISGLVNLLNMCEEAGFSVFLSDTEQGKIKGSLRSSEKKGINVNTISRFLGGGGHRLAAGFEAPGKVVEKHRSIKIK